MLEKNLCSQVVFFFFKFRKHVCILYHLEIALWVRRWSWSCIRPLPTRRNTKFERAECAQRKKKRKKWNIDFFFFQKVEMWNIDFFFFSMSTTWSVFRAHSISPRDAFELIIGCMYDISVRHSVLEFVWVLRVLVYGLCHDVQVDIVNSKPTGAQVNKTHCDIAPVHTRLDHNDEIQSKQS